MFTLPVIVPTLICECWGFNISNKTDSYKELNKEHLKQQILSDKVHFTVKATLDATSFLDMYKG